MLPRASLDDDELPPGAGVSGGAEMLRVAVVVGGGGGSVLFGVVGGEFFAYAVDDDEGVSGGLGVGGSIHRCARLSGVSRLPWGLVPIRARSATGVRSVRTPAGVERRDICPES